MKSVKLSAVLTVVASIVLVSTMPAPAAKDRSNGRGRLGKPLDGLNPTERRLFREGKEAFEQVEVAADGLGPTFNAAGCAVCHSSPETGGTTTVNETRAARVDGGQYFELAGGSLFQDNGINPNCKEMIPANANVIERRQTTPLFGAGLDRGDPRRADHRLRRRAAPIAPGAGGARPHRDGRGERRFPRRPLRLEVAARDAAQLQRRRLPERDGDHQQSVPLENAPNGDKAKLAACDSIADPEDDDDDVVHFANFMRLLAPPPREDEGDADGRGQGPGERAFERVGCAVCHRAGFRAESPISAIHGQKVDAFSDFLLHDVGTVTTGFGIRQGDAGVNEFRTPPLWGVSDSAPYLHDGAAATLREAIQRHSNQGASARAAFRALTDREKEALLAFLKSI